MDMASVIAKPSIDDNKSSNGTIDYRFADKWDKYSQKYNSLVEKIEACGIDINLLDEVISLKNDLTKINIIIKLDDLFKI